MNLKTVLVIATVLSIVALTSWEYFLRSNEKKPSVQDNNDLWSVERAKVDHLDEDDFVFVGSSRILFDVQLDVWEAMTGRKPVQLAVVGSSPLPTFRDLVRNTDFKGTIMVGVTPPLFFSTTFPQAPPISGPQEKVDYFQDRTYAQRLNHWLSLPLQRNFAMVHSYEDLVSGNFDLQSMLESIKMGNRTGRPQMPPFPEFGEIDENRNVRMMEEMVADGPFAQSIIDVWMFCVSGEMPPPDKASTTAFFLEDVELFKKRGGKVVLLRCPSNGDFREIERKVTPRNEFWDELVAKSALPAYHFEDYPQFQNLDLPEWSHLSAKDADHFTRELVQIMMADGLITNQTNN